MSTVGMTNRLELNSFAETARKAAAPLGFYSRTQDRAGASGRIAMAAALLVLTVAMGAVISAVSMAVWLPIVKAAYDNRKSIADTLSATIAYGGIDRAAKQYHDLKASQPGIYNFDEDQLNALGYQLIRANKFKRAIRVFQLNVEAYPQSSNVYDSLAEAYMDDGDKALAIANYHKSLQLNPKNRGALRMLRKLNRPGFVLRRAYRGPI
jgi:tetratricopeptide (TPR) repeat protein